MIEEDESAETTMPGSSEKEGTVNEEIEETVNEVPEEMEEEVTENSTPAALNDDADLMLDEF